MIWKLLWKYLPYRTLKSKGCLLTHGLPITSILLRIVRICRSLCKSSYLKNKKHFLGFLFHLWNLHQLLNIFRENKIVIANVFLKLTTVQGLLTPVTVLGRLKTSLDSQPVKRFQTLVKSSWANFYNIFSALLGEMIRKISPWLKFQITGLCVNRWPADYKYAVTDRECFPFPMQIQLS